jgi:sortase (surface protein transpeptidase)
MAPRTTLLGAVVLAVLVGGTVGVIRGSAVDASSSSDTDAVVRATAPGQAGTVLGAERPAAVARSAVGARREDPAPASAGDPATAAAPADDAAPAVPATLEVPAASVTTELMTLGTDDDGELEVPDDYGIAGWYAEGGRPGAGGAPLVIAGHVDSWLGRGVFHGLIDLVAGDEVTIHDTDGTSWTYRIDRVEQHAKDAFPTLDVYGVSDEPQLRLITCAGPFDRGARSYGDNVVVFATLIQR